MVISSARQIAKALDFTGFIFLNLSESELLNIEYVLLSEDKIFVGTKNKKLQAKLDGLAKQAINPFRLFFSMPEKPAVVLYSRFQKKPEKLESKTLIIWENVKPDSKRVLLSKRLFGYSQQGKEYPGLVQKYNSEKIGKGCIIVSSKHAGIFLKIFNDMKIGFSTKEVLNEAP